MKLTHEILHSAGTRGCGFNWHQLRVLGIGSPPPKGWLRGLIGTEISDERWSLVLQLGNHRRKDRRRILQANGIKGKEFAQRKLKDLGDLFSNPKIKPVAAIPPVSQPLAVTDPMPFGKFKGAMMRDVPSEYLHWLWSNGLRYRRGSPVQDYIERNLAVLKEKYPEGTWS